jgi:NADH-quinone oxidoreductase subunit F
MKQTKIITEKWAEVNPRFMESYQRVGGYQALAKALKMEPEKILQEVVNSKLSGRGGGGFPTGRKWQTALEQKASENYFICNLDESEPGTYKDRYLAENNPHQLLEGIIIASYVLNVKKAYIYLNGNFHMARQLLRNALSQAHQAGFLGKKILGSDFGLEIELFVGAGAYICGEESALINSIEGKRGEPRRRPPFACVCGLHNRPTVVNNAETIANLPWIVQNGGKAYAKIGLPEQPGTKLFSIGGMVRNPGLYEFPLGVSTRELIYKAGMGMRPGLDFWFAQMGGSAGRLVTRHLLDEIPSYSREARIAVGSGAVLVVDKSQDIKNILLAWSRFFARESCGQCVPCREGTFRMRQLLERLGEENFSQDDWEDLERIIFTLERSTFCALGKFAAVAVKDALELKLVTR